MPIKPQFTWEQTAEEVRIDITIKGFRKESVDVFISETFTKVNAPPTYVLALDLLHEIEPSKSSHFFLSAGDAASAADANTTTATSGNDTSKPAVTGAPAEEGGNNSNNNNNNGSGEGLRVCLRLRKREPGLVWEALCLTAAAAGGKAALLARREASRAAAEGRYADQLEARRRQREAETRRLNEAQWEIERRERRLVESRAAAEKSEAEADLQRWEEQVEEEEKSRKQAQQPARVPASPADIAAAAAATAGAMAAAPGGAEVSADPAPRRTGETACVTVRFTPKVFGMPTRSRGDEEYYRQSRYKPVSVEDSPMFWKERGDGHYRARRWREAAEAYSESIKRDGVFLTCVMNRAACLLRLGDFKRAAEDCTLALTLLGNTPASEITQERYRAVMTRLHARRAAARCWAGDLTGGLSDMRMAAAYRDPDADADIQADLEALEERARAAGLEGGDGDAAARAEARAMQEAAALYHRGQFAAAAAAYEALLAANSFHMPARSNLCACLLHLRRPRDVLEQCRQIVDFCGEVAAALAQPGGLATAAGDSDDDDDVADAENEEDEEEEEEAEGVSGAADRSFLGGGAESKAEARANRDELTRQRRLAAKKVSERSGHVYLLLKAYVRGAAALCALGELHQAHAYLEQALRITPFDNDLREDCNRIAERVRMDTLVAASTGAMGGGSGSGGGNSNSGGGDADGTSHETKG